MKKSLSSYVQTTNMFDLSQFKENKGQVFKTRLIYTLLHHASHFTVNCYGTLSFGGKRLTHITFYMLPLLISLASRQRYIITVFVEHLDDVGFSYRFTKL